MNFHWTFYILVVVSYAAGKLPTFTGKEKTGIDTLRSAIEAKLTLPYMKSDAYLFRWLNRNNFDQVRTKEVLEKTLEWRKLKKIDDVPLEDVGELKKRYLVDFTSTRDKGGRPVPLIFLGAWDVRRKALQGKLTDLVRRVTLLYEKGAQLSYNLTQDPTAMIIVNLNGFNLRNNVCAACLPFYVDIARNVEAHYPDNFYKIVIINTPAIFSQILNLVKPLVSPTTWKLLLVMGYNRAEWRASLSEFIDVDKLPRQFGGTGRLTVRE